MPPLPITVEPVLLFVPSLTVMPSLIVILFAVTPALLITVAPVVTLPSVPKSIFLAKRRVNESDPFEITPILLLVESEVAPPLIFKSCPSLRVALVSESPTKPSGLTTSSFKFFSAAGTV